MLPAHPIAAVSHHDPYPYYDGLAAHAPLSFSEPLGLWVVAGQQLLQSVLHDARFVMRPSEQSVPSALQGKTLGALFSKLIRMRDDAPRERTRTLLTHTLCNLSLPSLGSHVALQLQAATHDQPTTQELLRRVQHELPVRALASALGLVSLPSSNLPTQVHSFVRALAPTADAACITRGELAANQLVAAISNDLANPKGPLTGHAADARSPEALELIANLLGLLMQTYDATAGLIGNTLLALARTGTIAEAQRWSAQELLGFVARVQQLDPVIHNTRRFVAEPCVLAGQPLERDAPLLLVLASARTNALGWGAGAHACPGRDHACFIASQALLGVLQTANDLPLAVRHPRYLPLANARVPTFCGAGEEP